MDWEGQIPKIIFHFLIFIILNAGFVLKIFILGHSTYSFHFCNKHNTCFVIFERKNFCYKRRAITILQLILHTQCNGNLTVMLWGINPLIYLSKEPYMSCSGFWLLQYATWGFKYIALVGWGWRRKEPHLSFYYTLVPNVWFWPA